MAKKHCIVIGSGILGASVAWHLAQAGAEVTILEAEQAGGRATRDSWAWINASWGDLSPISTCANTPCASGSASVCRCPRWGWIGAVA